VQVGFGEREEFGERTGVPDDAQHGACRAVAAETPSAPFARAAGQIDLPYDALAQPCGAGRTHDFANEFVAGPAAETIVTAQEFDICVADSTGSQADQS
jgi:hypothetical protein